MYRYWVLRYVPDSLRGEFVNVGVIVGDGAGDWDMRRVRSLRRASRLGGDATRAEHWLTRLQRRFGQEAEHFLPNDLDPETRPPSLSWLEHQRGRLNNAVQISEGIPVSAPSAREAVEMLFPVLVLEPPTGHGRTLRDAAKADLYEAFFDTLAFGPRQLQRDVKLETMRQVAQFEFAVGDGHVKQLSRVVSFQRQGMDSLLQDVQAWSFAVGQLRRKGGLIRNPARKKHPTADVDPEVPVRVLYVPPITKVQAEAFKAAESAWSELDVKAYEAGHEAVIAREAGELLTGRAR